MREDVFIDDRVTTALLSSIKRKHQRTSKIVQDLLSESSIQTQNVKNVLESVLEALQRYKKYLKSQQVFDSQGNPTNPHLNILIEAHQFSSLNAFRAFQSLQYKKLEKGLLCPFAFIAQLRTNTMRVLARLAPVELQANLARGHSKIKQGNSKA